MANETETKLNFLVVDPSDEIRSTLEQGLKRLGHEVTLAADGESALQSLGTQHFNVALVGSREANAILAINQGQPAARIIVMMGGAPELTGGPGLMSAMRLGAHGVIAKPFTIDRLIAVVKGVFAAQGAG